MFQLMIFMIIRVFYFDIFYLLENEILVTAQFITNAYITLCIIWVISFAIFLFVLREN